jgi:hypothetical protein
VGVLTSLRQFATFVIPNDAFFIAAEESQPQPPSRASVGMWTFSPAAAVIEFTDN